MATVATALMHVRVITDIHAGTSINPIAAIESLKFHQRLDWNKKAVWDTLEQSIVPVAHHCHLSWCQRTHAATTCNGGILHDAPTSTTDLTFDYNTLQDPPGNRSGYSLQAGWPVDIPKPSTFQLDVSHWEDTNDVYWTDSSAKDIVARALYSTFNIKPEDIVSEDSVGQMSPVHIQLYNNALPQVLADVATSVTNALRQTRDSRPIEGKVYQPVTHVRVNWYWLIYPSAMALLATAFLVVSIVFSTERNGVVWKSSLLPLVLYGLKDHEHNGDASRVEDLEKESRALQVSLTMEHDHQGLGLRCVPNKSIDNARKKERR